MENRNNGLSPEAMDALDRFSGKNEDELFGELKRNAQAQRDAGVYSDESLKEFQDMIMPYLNNEQMARMARVLEVLNMNDPD